MPKACPVCGSRKWRKDGVTGNAICEDGHVFQDFRSENLVLEPTGVTLQRRVTQRVRTRTNKRKTIGAVNKEYYNGPDADWLRVQALQLLLRVQIQALTKFWSLPDAYEMIVKDVWTYQLSLAKLPVKPEARIGEDGEVQRDETKDNEPDEDKSDDSKSDREDDSKSDSSSEPGIDKELLEELSERSSSSEDEMDGYKDNEEEAKPRKKKTLTASDTLVCLIIGLWVIRYPVINVEIESLINSTTLPYIDFGRSSYLPEEMQRKINRDTMLALSPTRCPTPLYLHTQCRKLARALSSVYGLIFPEINLPPLAWRVVSSLGGNPTTYSQVTRLMALVDVNTFLCATDLVTRTRARRGRTMGAEEKRETYERTTRYEDVWLPELSVAAAWVVIMKMAYGLDGRERCPLVKSDPVIGLPKPERWIEELTKRLENGWLRDGRLDLDRQDFVRMDTDDIDRFLDKCQTVLLKDKRIPPDPTFPLPLPNPTPPPHRTDPWDRFHSQPDVTTHQQIPMATPNKQLPLLPGENICSYAAYDLTGTLPHEYEVVLKAAAEVVGVRMRDVAKVVESIERRLGKVKSARSRSGSRSRAGSRTQSRGPSRPPSRAAERGERDERSDRSERGFKGNKGEKSGKMNEGRNGNEGEGVRQEVLEEAISRPLTRSSSRTTPSRAGSVRRKRMSTQ